MADNDEQDSESSIRLATTEIQRGREKLAHSISALENEIMSKFDWHEWIRRKPALLLTLAFGLGYFLGRRK
jgi:hypothetical protein